MAGKLLISILRNYTILTGITMLMYDFLCRKLPFHDSKEKKRGGIQVNDTAPVAPQDAE